MRNILIVIKKQLKDTPKNITILIQFILFPVLTLIMENAINMEGMPELFFTKLFSMMYIGMAPLTSTAAIISEEKEKNTLRVLMMANVKPWQYLMGVGICVWGSCMAGAGIIATGLNGNDVPFYWRNIRAKKGSNLPGVTFPPSIFLPKQGTQPLPLSSSFRSRPVLRTTALQLCFFLQPSTP